MAAASPHSSAGAASDGNDGCSSTSSQLHRLPTTHPLFSCARCGAHLALADELISKAFSGRDGKAYLFHSVINASLGTPEERNLMTGTHTVADLVCRGCERSVGWGYLRAYEPSQRYKEGEQPPKLCGGIGADPANALRSWSPVGKFILERAALHKSNHWS